MVRARVGDARTSRIGGVSPLPAAPFAAWLGAVPRRAHRRSHRSCVDPTYELDLRPCRLQTSRAQAMPRLCELVLRRARMGGAEQRSFVEARMRGGHVHGRAVARCVHVRNVRVGVGVVAKYAARSIRVGFDGLLSQWTTAKLPRTPRRRWRYCARYAEGWGSRALVRARAHKVEEVERTFTRG